jgi:hypothetical protein
MDTFLQGIALDIKQGASFELPITWKTDDGDPVNLTGYTSARMQFRATVGAANPPLLDLTTANGSITIDGYNGGVAIFIPSNMTELLESESEGVWDLFLYGGTGIALSDLKGTYRVEGRVTR